MRTSIRAVVVAWFVTKQSAAPVHSLAFLQPHNLRHTAVSLSKKSRCSCPLLSALSHHRPLDEARVENRLAHEVECKRSEELFFHHTKERYDSNNANAVDKELVDHNLQRHDKKLWESFFFRYDNNSSTCKDDIQYENVLSTVIDSRAPSPFTQKDLAKVSKIPLFTKQDCSKIIQEAEIGGQWRNAQSQASYAKNASTFYPIRLQQLPQTKAWLDKKLESVIYPAVAQSFAVSHLDDDDDNSDCPLRNVEHFRCSAASIVKYNATAGQTSLGLHRDGPLIAATIPLNDMADYDGGGTFIEALTFNVSQTQHELKYIENDVLMELEEEGGHHDYGTLRRNTGHLILHPAMVRHAGETITRGLRYILVVWIFSADFIAHEYYSLIRANGYLAQALKIDPSSASQFRCDLLYAAINGYDEAIELGSGNVTETAYIGLGQALLELGTSPLIGLDEGEEDTLIHGARRDGGKDRCEVLADAVISFNAAIDRAPSNKLACQLREKATQILEQRK